MNKKHPDNLSTNRKAQKLLYDHTPIGLGLVPWLLADSGLLDGCSATIHRREIEEFAETFHNLTVSQRRFVKSSRVYICGGASTILDLMFEILSEFCPETAFEASNMFLYSREMAARSLCPAYL